MPAEIMDRSVSCLFVRRLFRVRFRNRFAVLLPNPTNNFSCDALGSYLA
jgi:hypothetical protein